MATIYRDKRHGTYYANYRVKGRRVRRALKTKSRAAAKDLLRRIDSELLTRRLGLAPEIRFTVAAEEFVRDRADVSPGQRKNYVYGFRTFLRWLGKDPLLSEITSDVLGDYRNFRAESCRSWTVNGDVRRLSALFRWAVEDKHYLNESPMTRNARRVTGTLKGDRRALTPAERAAYQVKLRDTPVYLAFMFGTYAGLRRGELIRLERSDIRDGVIHLTNKPHLGFTLKDYEARRIPLEPELIVILSRLPADGTILKTPTGRPWCAPNFGAEWTATMRRLKLPPKRTDDRGPRFGCSLHELRHTYASIQITERAVDVYTLSRRMGHCDVKTSQQYFHLFQP